MRVIGSVIFCLIIVLLWRVTASPPLDEVLGSWMKNLSVWGLFENMNSSETTVSSFSGRLVIIERYVSEVNATLQQSLVKHSTWRIDTPPLISAV